MEPVHLVRRAVARLWQRVGATIILVVAFLGLNGFLLYFLLNSTFTFRVFDSTVNTLFRGRIGWTRLSFGPMPWQLRILEPVLLGPDGRPVITARSVSIDSVRLTDLPGTIAADDIRIEGAVVRLEQRPHAEAVDLFGQPDMVFNIAEMFWPPGPQIDEGQPGGGVNLDFGRVEIVDATFVLDMPSTSIEVSGVDINRARFALSGESETMAIAAARLRAKRGEVRILMDEAAAPALTAPADATLSWPITDLNLNGFHWAEMAFRVTHLTAAVRGDPLVISSFYMDLDRPGVPLMGTRLRLDTDDVATHLRPLGVEGVHGAARLHVHGRGEIDVFDGAIELTSTDLDAFGWQAARTRVEARLEKARIAHVDALSVDAYGGTVQAQARFDLEQGHLWTRASLDGVRPATLPLGLDPAVAALIGGPLDGWVTARGRDLFTADRRLNADAVLTLRYDRPPPGLGRRLTLRTVASYGGDTLDLHQLDVRSGDTHLNVAGRANLAAGTGRFGGDVAVADLAGPVGAFGLPLSGRAKVGFTLRGDLADPTVAADVQGWKVQWAEFPAADVGGRARYAKGRLELDNVALDTAVGEVGVRGHLDLGRRGTPLALDVRARQVQLERLPLPVDVAGRVDADVRITGAASRPQIKGRARVLNPRYQRLAFERIDVAGRYAGDTIEVDEVRLTDGHELLHASGEVDLRTERFRGAATLTDVPLGIADPLLEAPLPVRGTVSLTLTGDGTFDDPSGAGQVSLRGFGYDTFDLGDGDLTLTAGDGEVSLEGRLFADFDLSATVPTTPGDGPARAEVRFADLGVGRYVPQLAESGLAATISGSVRAVADPFAGTLEQVTAALDPVEVTYRLVSDTVGGRSGEATDFVVRSDGPIEVSYRHGVLNVDRLRLTSAGQALGIAGTVGDDGTIDLQVAGNLNLAVAQPFLKSVFTQMSGRATVWLEVGGDLTDPRPTGRIRLDSLDLIPRSSTIGTELALMRPVELEIAAPYGPLAPAEGDEGPPIGVFTVALPPFAAPAPENRKPPNLFMIRRDDTEIEVTRFAAWFENFAPTSLMVEADASNITLNVPETVRATINARPVRFEMWTQPMARRAPETRLRLSGDIDVLRGEYVADITSASEINQGLRDDLRGRARAGSVSVFETSPILKRLMLDLRLRSDGDFFVRNQVTVLQLELETRFDLKVTGFLVSLPTDALDDGLRIDGQVTVLPDSRILYARAPYEVTQGSVTFGEQDFLNAELVATHTFRLRTGESTTAGIGFDRGLTGDVRLEEVVLRFSVRMATRDSSPDIDLGLSSSSGLSHIEVATLVLTGSLPSDLTGAASAQPATEVVLGPLLGFIERPLEETLEVDLALTPASSGTLYIDAEKLLSRRLRVYSRTPVGNEDAATPQTFGLEYQINNSTYGELTNEQTGNLNSTSGRLRLRLNLD